VKEKIHQHFKGDYLRFYSKYLPNLKRIGGQEFQALCPFHEDTKPSFNFNNENGKYFCHGCGKKGNALHFYAKNHSLDDRRDFPKILKGIAADFGIPWEENKRHLIKTYDYVDAEGNLLFQVCRFEPKGFGQRRPDGKGGWIWDLKGIETVLYNLPALRNAEEVLIVEGEKDVESARALGFAATTSPMGARKWREKYNEFLKGKDLILCPDNDQEGREHMTQVGASLNGTSKSLKWLDLPGLHSKGDISDWIASFQDPQAAAERLALLIDNAEPYTPPKKATLEDIILPASEFRDLPLPKRMAYLDPWLKEDSISLVSGWRGIGKTWFSWGIADAISKGEPFGPWKCEKAVPVMVLDGEMPPSDLQERIDALHIDSRRPSPIYIYSDALANQKGIARAYLPSEPWREKMKSILLARHVKLLIIDNLASLAGGLDENAKKDWDPINAWLLELRFQGIATLLLHHTNREGSQRGTSAREDNIDISILLKPPSDYSPEEGCRFVVSFTKARVSQSGLPLIAETEFSIQQDQTGEYIWAWRNVKKERKKEILKMLDEGMEYDGIKEALGLSSKGFITKVKKEAILAGYMAANGKLTQTGTLYVMEE
jgi:hypothetical protein